jgi:hypothetical protein
MGTAWTALSGGYCVDGTAWTALRGNVVSGNQPFGTPRLAVTSSPGRAGVRRRDRPQERPYDQPHPATGACDRRVCRQVSGHPLRTRGPGVRSGRSLSAVGVASTTGCPISGSRCTRSLSGRRRQADMSPMTGSDLARRPTGWIGHLAPRNPAEASNESDHTTGGRAGTNLRRPAADGPSKTARRPVSRRRRAIRRPPLRQCRSRVGG